MFLFVILKHDFLIKLYGEDYLEILFEDFVEKFDILDYTLITYND